MAVNQVSREHVLKVMERVGLSECVAAVARELPDPVDLKRDQALLEKYGLTLNKLIDRMGGSP
jgi:hypothetical protein